MNRGERISQKRSAKDQAQNQATNSAKDSVVIRNKYGKCGKNPQKN